MIQLFDLPTEIILMIFSLLSIGDIKNVCLVCSYLKQICDSTINLWNTVTLRIRINHQQDIEYLKKISTRKHLVTSLIIKKQLTISSHDWKYVRQIKTLTHCCLHHVNLNQLHSGEFSSFVQTIEELGWET